MVFFSSTPRLRIFEKMVILMSADQSAFWRYTCTENSTRKEKNIMFNVQWMLEMHTISSKFFEYSRDKKNIYIVERLHRKIFCGCRLTNRKVSIKIFAKCLRTKKGTFWSQKFHTGFMSRKNFSFDMFFLQNFLVWQIFVDNWITLRWIFFSSHYWLIISGLIDYSINVCYGRRTWKLIFFFAF